MNRKATISVMQKIHSLITVQVDSVPLMQCMTADMPHDVGSMRDNIFIPKGRVSNGNKKPLRITIIAKKG